MEVTRRILGSIGTIMIVAICGCGAPPTHTTATTTASLESTTAATVSLGGSTRSAAGTTSKRSGFVGAFLRTNGSPPFGIFLPQSSQIAPAPYPTPGPILTGGNGYCDRVSANGTSIDSAFQVDPTKLSNLIFLGARWARTGAAQFFIDGSHIFGAGNYAWGTLDAAQCFSLAYHNIRPVIDLEAGPVNYDALPNVFSPQTFATYQTAGDFGQWCGAVATHEKSVFPSVTQFSLPGNEVNSNPQLFPGGEPQIAAYSKACYAAIKAANPNAFVYGFELNMDGSINAPQFVRDELNLGCGPNTCYDGLAIHFSMQYPNPPAGTPCYPNSGGQYGMQCITDIQNATGSAAIHVLISETVYPVPASVPNEQVKAAAVVAEFTAFAANPSIDGAVYANVDECALYTGFFSGGCLISTSGQILPAYLALQWLASQSFI